MVKKDEDKVAQLKGKEAEDTVLKYLKKTNRPYGSSDISANLKNAVSKAATQKILLSLAERELVTQKTYGKATYFVAPQTAADQVPASEIDQLTTELERTKETLKERTTESKRLAGELGRVKTTPTDEELEVALQSTKDQIEAMQQTLEPLRAGQAPVSESDLAQLDADWTRWRNEWVRRKKVFKMLWDVFSDSLSSAEAAALFEDLGIEQDTPEHVELEKSDLCTTTKSKSKR